MKKSVNHFAIMYNCSKGVSHKRFENLFVNFTADARCRTKQVKQKLMSRSIYVLEYFVMVYSKMKISNITSVNDYPWKPLESFHIFFIDFGCS